MVKPWKSTFFIGFTITFFFLISLITLPDYGVNWDTFQHLARGQDYLRFFTTGETNNIKNTEIDGRISYYEKTDFDFTWANQMTIGHPPLNDIILALSNRIFYKHLGLVSDISGYQIYIVSLVFLGGCIIASWSYELFGFFPSFVSILTYYCFPLLFSEQHFNIKDPAVMVYMLGFLYFFWKGIVRKKSWNILICSLFLGLSLGTKFNIVFAPFFLVPWIVFLLIQKANSYNRKVSFQTIISSCHKDYSKMFTIACISVPIIGLSIFYFTYPALWANPVGNVMRVVSYYRDIGGSRCPYYILTPQWVFGCMDFRTLTLFVVTIPVLTLVLCSIGVVYAFKRIRDFGMALLLWTLMLSVTVFRVIIPISALYGGSLRQIMEIIIPLSLLSGAGVHWIIKSKRYRKEIVGSFIVLLFIPVIVELHTLHPNENLYRNSIGKVFFSKKGGEYVNGIVSYGNAYKQAVDWINSNAEPSAKVSLVNGIFSAVPPFLFRKNISYGPIHWSGWMQRGEYLMEQVDPGSHVTSFFPYRYVTRILMPVYEKKVDGYPIVRVWKNDTQFVRKQFQKQSIRERVNQVSLTGNDETLLTFERPVLMKQLLMSALDEICQKAINEGYILISEDGKNFFRMYEDISTFVPDAKELDVDVLYNFSGDRVKYLKIFIHGNTTCDLSTVTYEIIYFPE